MGDMVYVSIIHLSSARNLTLSFHRAVLGHLGCAIGPFCILYNTYTRNFLFYDFVLFRDTFLRG